MARASRVLPTPPGPVSVTSETSSRSRRSLTAATRRSRPISEVRGRGKLTDLTASGATIATSLGRRGLRLDYGAIGTGLMHVGMIEPEPRSEPAGLARGGDGGGAGRDIEFVEDV